ncbi:MAG TPA: antibiotic biosynthesis monooxygenase family protein [Casimicrobiaceae bacterium]|nr:antibiotic biosynthesis monooxygenase family protein [Casimicrobiaceae bacterium]
MILEVAEFRIKPGTQSAFDAAIRRGVETVIAKAKGFRGYKIQKGIDSPARYLLLIYWDSVENHTVDFRQSPAFQEWRAFVSPYFASPPVAEHFALVAES